MANVLLVLLSLCGCIYQYFTIVYTRISFSDTHEVNSC